MSQFVFGFLVLVFSFAQADMVGSASKFCENYAMAVNTSSRNNSLGHLATAMGVGGLGLAAKDSTPRLYELGFRDHLGANWTLPDESSIPDGAVFVFDKAHSPNCPVSEKYGHVAVKCGVNSMIFGEGSRKNITEFAKANPGCIRSLMYNPKWDVTAHPGNAPAQPGAQAQ